MRPKPFSSCICFCCLVSWFVGFLVSWLLGRLIGVSSSWCADRFVMLGSWMVVWLIAWLIFFNMGFLVITRCARRVAKPVLDKRSQYSVGLLSPVLCCHPYARFDSFAVT